MGAAAQQSHSAWKCRVARVFTLALGLALPCALAAQTPPAVQAPMPVGAVFQLPLASSPSTVQAEAGGREIVLIFPGPVSPVDLAALERATGTGLIEGLSVGQDAARLRLTRPAQPRLMLDGRGATLVLEPVGRGGGNWQERRLALAEAELAVREGDTARARATVAPLLEENPQDTALIERMAAIEAAAGRTRTALYMYERALGLDPGASSLVTARRALAVQQGPVLRNEGFYVAAPGGERVASLQITGSSAVAEGWRADFRIEGRQGEARRLRQTGQDVARSFYGQRARGEVGLERRWDTAGTSRIALLAGPRNIGFAAQHSLRVGQTELTASAAWNQPYWDTMMSFAGNAVRDRAGLDLAFSPARGFLAQVGTGFVRYSVPARADVAQGTSVTAALSWIAPESWMPVDGWQARFGYRLGAEYLSGVARGLTPQGQNLPLLDIRSREVHSLEAALVGPVGPAQVTLLAGYAYDRYGGAGPVGLMRAVNRDEGRLSFGIEMGVGPSLAENPRAVWRTGGFLIWRFGA